MSRREWALVAVCALLGAALGLALAVPVAGIGASRPSPVAQSALAPVTLSETSGAPAGTLRPSTNAPAAATAQPVAPTPAVASSPTPRPSPSAAPSQRPSEARPAPTPSPSGRTGTAYVGLRGAATWFAAPDGTAAAGPALRALLGPSWRGQRVRVCSGGRCVSLVLADWCACGDRGGVPTLIDLNRASFAALAALSRGVLAVTVEASR